MSESKLPPGAWHEPGATRIPPPPKNQVGFIPKSLLAMIKRKAGVKGDLNFLSIMPRLGPIFVHWALFGGQLLMKGRISRADKERIILRTVWRLGCIYEWGHHVRFARELGVTDAEISSLAEEQSGLWSARTRALVMATDDLVQRRRIGDEAWAQLRRELSEDQAVEFCMVVGHHVMVVGMINSLDIRIEPGYLTDNRQ